jgi:hypothetical protein
VAGVNKETVFDIGAAGSFKLGEECINTFSDVVDLAFARDDAPGDQNLVYEL